MLSSFAGKRISVIIPAAGANTRLTGTVAPFLKPTILCDGRPLIQHAYEHAWNDWQVPEYQTRVVVSPDNAAIIPKLFPLATTSTVHFVLQPNVTGIVNAIYRGLIGIKTEWTLILCADNVFRLKPEDPLTDDLKPIFGAKMLKCKDASRFTTFEGDTFLPASKNKGSGISTCWIGPLLLPTSILKECLYKNEESITTLLNRIHRIHAILPHMMDCSDMGVAEELL
jgi:hypothetical protein